MDNEWIELTPQELEAGLAKLKASLAAMTPERRQYLETYADFIEIVAPLESLYGPVMEQCNWGDLDDYLPKCDAEAFGWVHAIWRDPPCGNEGCSGHGNEISAPLCRDHIDDLRRRVPADAQFWVE